MRATFLACIVWVLAIPGDALGHESAALQRFEFSRIEMAIPFRIVAYGESAAQAQAASQAAFDRIAELNRSLSDYDAGSEVSLLSRSSGSNRWVVVSEDLWTVIERSQRMAQRTQGAFDASVGPAIHLWRKARREQQLPDPDRLADACQRIGYRFVQLDARRRAVLLRQPGMRLDFGAIAKGFAIDEALAVLRTNGIQSALVAGGGDMAVSAPPPGRRGWQVEIGAYDAPDTPSPRSVEIAHCGLATSGDTFQRLEINGVRYSHIVDPRTGIGLTNHALVTVIAPDCMTADSWSTALSVLGPRSGSRHVRRVPGLAARWMVEEQHGIRVTETPRFARYLRQVDGR